MQGRYGYQSHGPLTECLLGAKPSTKRLPRAVLVNAQDNAPYLVLSLYPFHR